jgi:hypothetical protein
VIELFARNELGTELKEDQYIIPIQNASAARLSAILLDDEYFELIRNNVITSKSGVPIINPIANICLKARAHRELLSRQSGGDPSVDDADIRKHLKDIWRLAILLTGQETPSLSPTPKTDVVKAIAILETLPEDQFKMVMQPISASSSKGSVMALLKKVFSQ